MLLPCTPLVALGGPPPIVPIELPGGCWVPAAVRCLFHIMPTFCPSVCASVTAMAATLPYCTREGQGRHRGDPPHPRPASTGVPLHPPH